MLKYSPSFDKLRFEIHSSPGRGQQKWYIKGSHAVEVGRWTQAIAHSIELARREAARNQSQSGSDSESVSLRHLGADLRISTSSRKESREFASSSSIHDSLEENVATASGSDARVDEADEDEEGDRAEDDSSDASSQRSPPYETEFALHGNTTAAQVELTGQLLESLVLPANAPRSLHEIRAALEDSTKAAIRMVGEYVRMVAEREEWWKEKVARERARGALWEESLQTVVKEGAALEEELRSRARTRRRSSRGSQERSRRTSMDIGRSTLRLRGHVQSGIFSPPPFHLEQPPQAESVSGLPIIMTPEGAEGEGLKYPSPVPEVVIEDVEDLVSTDEEDEFFDAIESNQLPVIVPDALVKPPPVPLEKMPFVDLDQYQGYAAPRWKLPIDQDTRPPTSLWSVLKHSIGKDLTKISFPVFFNEPTSMLQRMVRSFSLSCHDGTEAGPQAEDMEFSECRMFALLLLMNDFGLIGFYSRRSSNRS